MVSPSHVSRSLRPRAESTTFRETRVLLRESLRTCDIRPPAVARIIVLRWGRRLGPNRGRLLGVSLPLLVAGVGGSLAATVNVHSVTISNISTATVERDAKRRHVR